jgi:hypothetical protein
MEALMGVDSTPLRRPASWKDSRMSDLLQATPFTIVGQQPPPGVTVVQGPWPGVRLSQAGGDRASAGPTGEPWVDSNGWRIRIANAQHPGARVWVDAKPQASRTSPADYVIAFADAAAHGARWIVTLDDTLAAGIAAKSPDAIGTWNRIIETAKFFTPREQSQLVEAVIGVLSTFTGPKAGFTGEVLNNLARTKQQYRAILAGESLTNLKAVIYTDAAEPSSDLRKQVLDFVNAGGMLITSSAWSSIPKGPPASPHPRFATTTVGKGTIAIATTSFADPYLAASDAVVLVSHRHDVVRFFNGGAITPCLTLSPDKRRASLDTVFYSARPVEDASVWIKGSYKTARLRVCPEQQPREVRLEVRDAGVEVYLPAIAQYARIELES